MGSQMGLGADLTVSAYHDLETWRGYLRDAGFQELTHYYRPEGLPRDQQPWLASVWRKIGINSRS